jgi:citrate lyase subunit beta/citryl-CoA lyase
MNQLRAAGITWLFVPADRPERYGTAVAAGPDAVIVDLEDAVTADHKVSARGPLRDWLSADGRAWVRLNAATTTWYADDLDALTDTPGLAGVVLPKAEDLGVVHDLRSRLPETAGVIALVESAAGVLAAH